MENGRSGDEASAGDVPLPLVPERGERLLLGRSHQAPHGRPKREQRSTAHLLGLGKTARVHIEDSSGGQEQIQGRPQRPPGRKRGNRPEG